MVVPLPESARELVHLEQRIAALEKWRLEDVNGTLARLDERVSGLQGDVAAVKKGSDVLRMWLIGVLASAVLTLLGTVVTLLILLQSHT